MWLGDLGQVSSLLLSTKEETGRNFPKGLMWLTVPRASSASAEGPAKVTLIEQGSNALER